MSRAAILTCKNLTIGYQNQKTITREISKGLNLQLNRGELVCLVGPNGSGKSTLIRTLTGIQPPLSGEVLLLDKKIADHRSEEKAKTMSVVLTTPVQAGYMTAFDIVALGRFPHTNWVGRLTEDDTEIILSAIASVGAGDLTYRFIHEMSDGERQKVMIARALAQEPVLMVLDEPTAFLDIPHKIETMRILRSVARSTSKAILLSTHDLNLAIRSADRLWIIDQHGALITGIPEDLVLSGIFGSAFGIHGASFDPVRGEFTIPIEKKGTFALRARKSVERIWTWYALERIGYLPADGERGDITVTIRKVDGKPVWEIRTDTVARECSSLAELIETISANDREG
ncbi:MAG: ABC transporter ATP-binding protein [Methanomicrobiaceae archaeon]|uniref:Putative iron(Iii) abc transporter, atp-binding protein n=1 Tax=hydrocarbon metagenome TaxID=938273 RepID=A0A0W8FF58_9ZZZZ|nr:ABC transporter ATP-binding protein [Methanomicrobiaceae archaeon]MDD5419251.1 ABC transporter ATP-binding protein [Methanomicrobiaceae archaeon]